MMPAWVDGAARDLGVVAGIVVALGIIATKTPLGRILAWIYKRLFGQPITEWLRNTIHGVIDPVVQALSDRNDEQHIENAKRLEKIEKKVAEHGERLDRGGQRMDHLIKTLDGLQTDVAALRTNPPRSHPL
jgi:tetrahydromethanopterin S-methyltransferase subunit G